MQFYRQVTNVIFSRMTGDTQKNDPLGIAAGLDPSATLRAGVGIKVDNELMEWVWAAW